MNPSDCTVLVHCTLYMCATSFTVLSVCLSLQSCESGGGANVFGIGSMNSASVGDVSTIDWEFTMSYSNAAQGMKCHVKYTFAASGSNLVFIAESSPNVYVSCCSLYGM